ncbi:MAG: 5-(carboxyamino)imidazole ribonucleotide synthase [Chitinophagales bacterium]|nr:5-(carboxyamino)imidazole ribonucleotide synthase [Chitinophagales bacterium]MCZ2393181.1 5-(carboxyamino)imidazole ribonucleotide synthase [Chitinophagales bacterium]
MSQKLSALPSIGIIGGGQLGRMFLQNSYRYGSKVVILESDPESPAGQLTHLFVKGDLVDAQSIRILSQQCDVITYEIEHINSDVLLELEAEGKKVIPSATVLKTIQDKGLQKLFYKNNSIPTSDFLLVDSCAEWLSAMNTLGGEKFAVKSRTGGYDGKGVFLTDISTIEQGKPLPFDGPVVIEKLITCKKELAVLVAVAQDGSSKVYPVVDMAFHPISNLVTYLYTPSEISPELELNAQSLAEKTVRTFNSPGLFAVEFFLDEQDNLYVNEIAPRLHNSAHHTIEGAYTSQFDQLYRILTGLPLGDTSFRQAAVMINIVGPEEGSGDYVLVDLDKVLNIPGVYLHMYGKSQSKPHRKLGHITVVAETIEAARKIGDEVEATLKVQIV